MTSFGRRQHEKGLRVQLYGDLIEIAAFVYVQNQAIFADIT